MKLTRRHFLGTTAGAGLLGGLDVMLHLPLVGAAELTVTPDVVRFTSEMEPLVRLIEETPRSKAVQVLAKKVRKGLSYRQFLGALFLAGIRNVNPQPPGFKFHCVFIIHSANYLSRMAPPNERFLPLFYALDDFKKAQQEDVRMGDFVLRSVKGTLPTGQQAWDEFRAAMDDWDEPRADRAIVALAREERPARLFEGLWEYGARDYRNIGHKAIFVAHAWRTLEAIGMEHAEPTLRSLVLGLLDFGKATVVNGYAYDDQAYHYNRAQAAKSIDTLPGQWASEDANDFITLELLDIIRQGEANEATDYTLRVLGSGACRAGAIWNAVHLIAGELMMRQPGLIGVHTVTSTNSLQYGFRTSTTPQTRLLMLLQGVGWMAQFRNFLPQRRDRDVRITDLEPATIPGDKLEAAEHILASISEDRSQAARQALAFGRKFADPAPYFDGARHLVFAKSIEHHQLKWPAAIFENYYRVSPQWRPHMLATSVHYLRGSGHRNSSVYDRTIDALKLG